MRARRSTREWHFDRVRRMIFRYLVAHSDSALPPSELALHGLSPDDVMREHELVDFPFEYFFQDKRGVTATFRRRPADQHLEINLELDGTQRDADDLLAQFLIGWNRMVPGLAVILKQKLPAAAPDRP
jgi:hypothetical protein